MSVPSWARVGAKVVMVDGSADLDGDTFATGRIYIIKAITEEFSEPAIKCHRDDQPAIGMEWSRLSRFRPLVIRTQEQDVRAIKSMLRDMPAESRLDRLLEALGE